LTNIGGVVTLRGARDLGAGPPRLLDGLVPDVERRAAV